ncbi:MAG: peptide-methionine (S)-S-oxide reductase MsrA [Candidatus Marinimicrobia bacterium]|nr:peptide-methionine (S)-S-oxide reductase MsrA [Candidatus Neomarinimicrobiota bacterium]
MNQIEQATFGGGCFWCVEAVFQRVEGVISVKPGYASGHTQNPTYKDVCSGETGHAEVARIEFDPAQVTFDQLLNVFWQAHDPTTLNRQGADVGTQYRSIILYHNNDQKGIAEKSIKDTNVSGYFDSPIVTTIEALDIFYPAEDYHDNYYELNSSQGYCQYVIKPKLDKLSKKGVIR